MSKPRPHDETQASPPATDVKRRRLLMALGAGGAGAAAAAATPITPPTEAAKAPAQDAGGYRLTDHVRDYYATARL